MMDHLPLAHLDFETFSACDIRKGGGYRYAHDESTEVLIAKYAIGEQDKQCYTPTFSKYPERQSLDNMEALYDHIERGGRVAAHNAAFERAIWENVMVKHHDAPKTKIHQWICTAAQAAASGLPRSLAKAVAALNTGNNAKEGDANYIIPKDKAGDRLIRIFCVPRKATKKNLTTRIYPDDQPDDFEDFIRYCDIDVESERQLAHFLPMLPLKQQRYYWLDMRMNTRGMPIDRAAVDNAYEILTVCEKEIKDEVNVITKRLTGAEVNPTQTAKILELVKELGDLNDDEDDDIQNLRKKTVVDLLTSGKKLNPDMRRLLELRLEASKASTKKLARMQACICPDDRIRGGFLFHGAHTSRTSGQLIQPQNFKQGFHDDPKSDPGLINFNGVFDILQQRDAELFKMIWPSPIDTISMCMRGFIRAKAGHKLIPVDYASIEVRVLMWLAGQEDMLESIREGKDTYVVMASKLFNVSYDEVTKPQRHIGKQLILGCGYQLGARKFVEYVANSGTIIEPDFAKMAVDSYRESNHMVKQFWSDIEECAINAVVSKRTKNNPIKLRNIKFYVEGFYLAIERPSGIAMRYPFPEVNKVDVNLRKKAEETDAEHKARINAEDYSPWIKEQLSFQTEYKGQIVRESTYGGKLVENITQATAADVLFNGMEEAERAGYKIIGTVHDELIPEVPIGFGSAEELEEIICKIPSWATGLPLKAEGFETERYRK